MRIRGIKAKNGDNICKLFYSSLASLCITSTPTLLLFTKYLNVLLHCVEVLNIVRD